MPISKFTVGNAARLIRQQSCIIVEGNVNLIKRKFLERVISQSSRARYTPFFCCLPRTIHMTMPLPNIATSTITTYINDHKSFCHHGRSNGRSWLSKIQLEIASRRTSGWVERSNASSRTLKNSLRFNFSSTVTLRSSINALQLYRSASATLLIFVRGCLTASSARKMRSNFRPILSAPFLLPVALSLVGWRTAGSVLSATADFLRRDAR